MKEETYQDDDSVTHSKIDGGVVGRREMMNVIEGGGIIIITNAAYICIVLL